MRTVSPADFPSSPARLSLTSVTGVPGVKPDLKVMQLLSDSRDFAWVDLGDSTGWAVFAFHGSPGRCHEFAIYDEIARDCGIRLIAVDRPGYGHSAFQPKRKLADFPDDIMELADRLQVERFAVFGHSAGGPHALSCAHFLPDRVLACGVAGGIAPSAHLRSTEGMLLTNRIQMAVYRHWPRTLDGLAVALGWLASPFVAAALRHGRQHPESSLARFSRLLPSCDVGVITRPEIRAQLLAELREFTPAVARTSVQDMALCFRDWDFHPENIDVPVHIWQGDLDRNVPVVHGEILAQTIPCATLHECPGEGHLLVMDHMEEILKTLASCFSAP